MSTAVVSSALCAALVAIAALHIMWGMGSRWPANDEAGLVRTVVGIPGMKRMPARSQAFAVALVLLAAAAVPPVLAGWIVVPGPAALPLLLAGWFAAVFFLRGVLGYTGLWRRRFAAEPFATLDVRVYSPLCLIIGAGFAELLASA